MPVKNLLSKCIFQIPNWFEVSKNELNTDLLNSNCVIYMQTSVGIQALLNGIPIIHLNINSPLSCDPLVKYHGKLKWVVKNSEELKNVLNEIDSINTDNINSMCENSLNKLKEYFKQPTLDNLKYFMQ